MKAPITRRDFIYAASSSVAVAGSALFAANSCFAVDTWVASVSPELLSDWTIDDMWGVYPRPAEALPFGRPASHRRIVAITDDPQLAVYSL